MSWVWGKQMTDNCKNMFIRSERFGGDADLNIVLEVKRDCCQEREGSHDSLKTSLSESLPSCRLQVGERIFRVY